jgi:hypothetical protein
MSFLKTISKAFNRFTGRYSQTLLRIETIDWH